VSRFDDFLPTSFDEHRINGNVLAIPSEEVLRWKVVPSDHSVPYEIDLSDFANGSMTDGISPRANLILQLAPAIRARSQGRAVHYKYETRDMLKKFWAFLDSLSSAGGGDISDLSQVSNSHGGLLKIWLLRSANLSLSAAANALSVINLLVRIARELDGSRSPEILWPNIQLPRRTLHADVDELALQHLFRHSKELHRGFRAAESEGRALLDVAVQTGPAEPGRPRKANSKEEIALLAYDFLNSSLADPGIFLKRFAAPSFFNQKNIVAPKYVTPVERRPFDAVRWFAPAAQDTMAAFTMVLLHTGWNPETVFGIDVSADSEWFDDRMAGPSGSDKTATVAIYGLKGKTGSEQIAFSLKQPWSHPYQVIKYMIKRTEPLRASLRESLTSLEAIAQPTFDEEKNKARLRKMIRSPWLYFISSANFRGRVGGRVGVLSSKEAYTIFKALRVSAAANLTPWRAEADRNRIVQGLANLKLSDARDGFAAFVYDDSMYNILLLRHALGHGSIIATKHYLRQRSQIVKRFERFTAFQDVLFDEVRNHRVIDPSILFMRLTVGEVTQEQRKRLSDRRMRTRMNMGCLNPQDPPREFAETGASGVCVVQRCTLCRHAVVFEDSFPAIAVRQAELSFIRSRSASDSFSNSSFSMEWAAIRVLIDNVFPHFQAAIEAETAMHLQKLKDGSVYIFDQVPPYSKLG
jgi:hypothetical protein